MGPRRQSRRDTALASLEQEAAEAIEARIADGRPPPDVWRAAAKRRAARGLPAGAWYGSTDPAPIGPPAVQPGPDPATVGRALILRSVRLPLSPTPAVDPSRWAHAPRIVADASN